MRCSERARGTKEGGHNVGLRRGGANRGSRPLTDNECALDVVLVCMFLGEPKRAKHFMAMVLIGDGVMALVNPRNDAKAWKKGPLLWQTVMQGLSKRPGLTRAIAAAQVIGGVWWALHQDESE
jgi:hypothetical protein